MTNSLTGSLKVCICIFSSALPTLIYGPTRRSYRSDRRKEWMQGHSHKVLFEGVLIWGGDGFPLILRVFSCILGFYNSNGFIWGTIRKTPLHMPMELGKHLVPTFAFLFRCRIQTQSHSHRHCKSREHFDISTLLTK